MRLVDALDAVLPQTQCTRCGYPDCRHYAQALADGQADINQCPPGGAEGVQRLSRLTGRPVIALNPVHGEEKPRAVARIDESWCIGCTLCIKACPVDCIVGANKLMHTVVEADCTGCELCVPACPVDCIQMVPMTGQATGWNAWSPGQAEQARARYAFHLFRVAREKRENDERLAAKAAHKLADLENQTLHTDPEVIARKRAVIEAALARARAQRPAGAGDTAAEDPTGSAP
ncbi:electron transport complex subunit RsxB [Ideonella livida]|uniref:electron transport complex subunit RsxB n=1 Tax=Ideonella livida TaxID=2707176 RepID=UPI002873BA43|nr:electron transport complex subunit RsxB [Ideonella livida]